MYEWALWITSCHKLDATCTGGVSAFGHCTAESPKSDEFSRSPSVLLPLPTWQENSRCQPKAANYKLCFQGVHAASKRAYQLPGYGTYGRYTIVLRNGCIEWGVLIDGVQLKTWTPTHLMATSNCFVPSSFGSSLAIKTLDQGYGKIGTYPFRDLHAWVT